MTKIWYEDITVLLKNKNQFFPKKEFSMAEKANSLVRLALYYSLIIIIFGFNQKYLAISLLLVSLSVFINRREGFTISMIEDGLDYNNKFVNKAENDFEIVNNEFSKLNNDNGEYKEFESKSCYGPTDNNPFMNFTLDDHYNRPNRPQNCNIKDAYPQMREKFLKGNLTYTDDLWGTDVSDRSFYTMPNTKIVNEQKKFAEWCFSSMGQCKAFNKDCVERALTRTGTDRYSFSKV